MKKEIIELFMVAWAIVSAFLAILGVVVLFTGNIFPALCILAPVALFWKVTKLQDNKGKTAFEKMASEIGANRSWWGNANGIALSSNKSKILFAKDGVVKTYDFDQVRSWESRIDSTRIQGNASPDNAGFDLAQAKLAAVAQRHANTGMFISVKDIENPVWHIKMMKEADLAKWFEILTQEINEREPVNT